MIKPLSRLALRACFLLLLLFPTSAQSDGGVYGMVWLKIDPDDAKIVLDGHFLDVGIWLLSIPPGSHDLEVQKAGYRVHAQEFDIVAGESLHLTIRLEREPGNAPKRLTSEPNTPFR